MNPIDTTFARLKAAGRKAFIPFLSAGDPDLSFTGDLLPAVAAAGADLIEVGIPFSDPIADGPVIQASYTRALANKRTLADIFTTVSAAAPMVSAPMAAMASYSLIYKQGIDAFITAAVASGISGAVVPDLPVEEADEMAKRCRDRDFKLILLVTPTTSPDRMAKIVAACSGFVYVVSLVGITGEKAAVSGVVRDVTSRLRTLTDLPLCVGFGVSRPEHVIDLKPYCDGVIVGSALVKLLDPANRAGAKANVVKLVTDLSRALNG